MTPQEAVKVLSGNLKHPSHRFWADAISFGQAVELFGDRLIGHQQVSDAYLLGLAIHKKGKLATLDRSLLSLLPERSPHRELVTVL